GGAAARALRRGTRDVLRQRIRRRQQQHQRGAAQNARNRRPVDYAPAHEPDLRGEMTEPQAAAAPAPVTAAVMIIGNEILSGRTVDANLPYIACELTKLGIRLMEVRVVADIEADIVDAINA